MEKPMKNPRIIEKIEGRKETIILSHPVILLEDVMQMIEEHAKDEDNLYTKERVLELLEQIKKLEGK